MSKSTGFLDRSLGGASLAPLVHVIAHATTRRPPIELQELVLLGVILGPFVEEFFFRGCLQQVIARSPGSRGSILVTAILFAALHQIATPVEWLCLVGTGTAYGWMTSRFTAAAACLHAAYNLALFLCQFRWRSRYISLRSVRKPPRSRMREFSVLSGHYFRRRGWDDLKR